MSDRDRIERYVRAHFAKRTEFPTVRRVARSLRMRTEVVTDEASSLPLMLTGYGFEGRQVDGDLFVEICE